MYMVSPMGKTTLEGTCQMLTLLSISTLCLFFLNFLLFYLASFFPNIHNLITPSWLTPMFSATCSYIIQTFIFPASLTHLPGNSPILHPSTSSFLPLHSFHLFHTTSTSIPTNNSPSEIALMFSSAWAAEVKAR